MIREWVHAPYTVLGTDGFGRSDTRPALRRFFEIDGEAVLLQLSHRWYEKANWMLLFTLMQWQSSRFQPSEPTSQAFD